MFSFLKRQRLSPHWAHLSSIQKMRLHCKSLRFSSPILQRAQTQCPDSRTGMTSPTVTFADHSSDIFVFSPIPPSTLAVVFIFIQTQQSQTYVHCNLPRIQLQQSGRGLQRNGFAILPKEEFSSFLMFVLYAGESLN